MNERALRIEVAPARGHTVHGGQVAVAALCKKLGRWSLVRAEPALDPRKDRPRGFAPEVLAAWRRVQRALGWQCLFVGPFLADQILNGDNTPVSVHLSALLEANASRWAGTPASCFADSAPSEGQHRDLVRQTFPHWSISDNRWTEPLERVAAEQPASAWTTQQQSHYAWVRHQPEGCAQPPLYAVRRWP